MRAAMLLLVCAPLAVLQPQKITWRVAGDTGGAPRGCRTGDGLDAIDRWFTAFNAADSVGLARSVAPQFVVSSSGPWGPTSIARRVDDIDALVAYARERRRHEERLTLDSVRFHGWRGDRLGFMPFYRRAARDLGAQPVPGLAKAEYRCGQGISVFNMGPDPMAMRQSVHRARARVEDGVHVRYLANEGVLLIAGRDKVLIDALYVPYDGYAVPDEQVRRHLVLAQPPFDSVDVVLVTHRHGDHFDPTSVARHLRFNPHARLVTSRQVIDSLRAGESLTGVTADRLLSRTMRPGSRRRETINGVTVEVLGIPHGGNRHRHVEHLGFIIEMGGRRVLHVGDTDVAEATYAPLRLDTAQIDVALVPYWALLNENSRRVIERYIKPKHIVAMHVDAGRGAGARIARQIDSLMPGVVTFRRSLESRHW